MARSGERAVAVLGTGVRTPAGNTVDALWDALCAGRTTARRYEHDELPADTRVLACHIADLDAEHLLSGPERRRLDRSHVLAIAAADRALTDAALATRPEPERCAVVCGVGFGAPLTAEAQHRALLSTGVRGVTPFAMPMLMPNAAASQLAMRLDFRGPCLTVSSACASGATAIGEGVELLRRGAADLVLAGGVDAMVSFNALAGFLRLDAMSRNVDEPALASRPFDVDRDGFVLSEGAGFVVLVRAADVPVGSALAGTLLGYASNADAHHLVAPEPDGAGAVRCIELALDDAGVTAADVAHVNAHGTSTTLNDLAEARALAKVFGDRCPPVTAVKGTTGHMIGGSGAVEAIVAMRSATERTAPPIAGLRTVDPEIAPLLNLVAGAPREIGAGVAVSNSFGFGGLNAVLVVAAAT